MTDQDWQARALEVAHKWHGETHRAPLVQADILAFAREYAAAETERLRATLAEWLKQNGPGGWIDELRETVLRLFASAAPKPTEGE